jgi:hypothetical protein
MQFLMRNSVTFSQMSKRLLDQVGNSKRQREEEACIRALTQAIRVADLAGLEGLTQLRLVNKTLANVWLEQWRGAHPDWESHGITHFPFTYQPQCYFGWRFRQRRIKMPFGDFGVWLDLDLLGKARMLMSLENSEAALVDTFRLHGRFSKETLTELLRLALKFDNPTAFLLILQWVRPYEDGKQLNLPPPPTSSFPRRCLELVHNILLSTSAHFAQLLENGSVTACACHVSYRHVHHSQFSCQKYGLPILIYAEHPKPPRLAPTFQQYLVPLFHWLATRCNAGEYLKASKQLLAIARVTESDLTGQLVFVLRHMPTTLDLGTVDGAELFDFIKHIMSKVNVQRVQRVLFTDSNFTNIGHLGILRWLGGIKEFHCSLQWQIQILQDGPAQPKHDACWATQVDNEHQ